MFFILITCLKIYVEISSITHLSVLSLLLHVLRCSGIKLEKTGGVMFVFMLRP